ncbi:MAG: DUF1028 domain-containing protein [Hyphomicrobiales bacterium]
MTFSLLVRDPGTGAFGAAAATGNLCVGAWVLRGDARAGVTASQGLYPNPSWGPRVLELMSGGDAAEAVRQVVGADSGRDVRQLAALDRNGRTAVHSGIGNLDYCGHIAADDLIAVGNMLESRAVLEAMVEAFASEPGAARPRESGGPESGSATTGFPLARDRAAGATSHPELAPRLIASLAAGAAAGGDVRGLMSAAVLVVSPDAPPLDLRVDLAEDPVGALRALYERTREPSYQAWLSHLPTGNDPERAP